MGICSCQSGSPLTDRQVLVDKLIGTPYELVKYVAANMGLVSYVANIFKGAAVGQPMLTKRTTSIEGKLNGLGDTVVINIPPEIDPLKIEHMTVRIAIGTNVFLNYDLYFTARIVGSTIQIISNAAAPAGFIDAVLKCHLIYGE